MSFGRLALGLGLGAQQQTGGGGVSAPTATATMSATNLSADQIFQRDTLSGGGQAIGQGTVPIAFSALTQAGTLNFRVSSGGATRGDLQPETAGPTVASTGAQTVNFTGIDARLGWFYIDVRDASGWQNGTTRIGMGDLHAGCGQSLMTASQKCQTGDAVTIATIDANIRLFSTYETYNATSLPTWESPTNGRTASNHYNSTITADYLRIMAAANGCNQGFIGHSASGQPQMYFQPTTGTGYIQFAQVVAAAGGKWRYEIWGQGHEDAANAVPGAQYYRDLDYRVFGAASGSFSALNSYPGTVKRLVFTIPSLYYTVDFLRYGTVRIINDLRKWAKAWCAAKHDGVNANGVYVDIHDFWQYDGIHEQNDQSSGYDHMAVALARAAASDNSGPVLTSATRTAWDGTKTVIRATLTNAGTALVGSGNWWERFVAYVPGSMQNYFSFSNGTIINSTTVDLSITAQDPGDGAALDLMALTAIHSDIEASHDYRNKILRDNRTSDGFPWGRALQPTTTPITVAAPSPGGTVNAPTGAVAPYSYQDITLTSPTYAAAEVVTGWGKPLNGGSGSSAAGKTASLYPATIAGWLTIPSTVSANTVIFGVNNGINIILATNRTLRLSYPSGTLTGTTVLAAGTYYVWGVVDDTSSRIYIATGPGQPGSLYATGSSPSRKFAVTNLQFKVASVSSNSAFGWAYWNSALWPVGGPTLNAPTTPYTGTEGMLNYFPFTDVAGGLDSVRGA